MSYPESDRATKPTEIEITPAMIKAGVEEFCLWENGDRPTLIVESIFRQMASVSCQNSLEVRS